MKKLLLALALLLIPAAASAQCNGLFTPGNVCANGTASPAPPAQTTFSSLFTSFCSASPNTCGLLFGYYNAQWFGVKCDGTTDDSTNSQTAITTAAGRPLYYPAGTCKISTSQTYTATSGGQSQGLQIYGQGPYKTIFDNEVANGYLFAVDGTTGHFSVGTTFANFGITSISGPTNSGGISLHLAWSTSIKNVVINNLTGTGISGTASAGDADAASVTILDQVRMNNIGGWCASFTAPTGGYYGSNTRIQNFLFSSCGAATNVVPPTSGGLLFKGLEMQLVNGGFTTNNGPDFYVQTNDTSINISIDGVDFENNSSTMLPHVYSDTGLHGFRMFNSECLNNDSFIGQGCVWSTGALFDAQISNIRVRAPASNNTYTAFKLGANDDPTTIRFLPNMYWIDFDHAGQTRFSGVQFDPILGTAQFSISSVNTAKLAPSGVGNIIPLRLAATGEPVPCAIPSAGTTLGSIGGLTPSTLYYFYAYNSAATVFPITCAIDSPSLTAPTPDTVTGFDIKTGDPTRTYIGAWPTDGSGNFQTTGAGFSWYPFGQSIPFGAIGTIYQGQGTSPPVWTRNPQLGNSGVSLGSLSFANVTSGTITLQSITGALGSSVLTLPAITDTVAGKALANGGTNNSLTASNGGIVWSDASKLNILSGTATANLPMLSGATATPVWATITYPTSATSGGIPYFSSTTAISSSALLVANALMIGGGAGTAPATTTTGTGVVTALGVNIGTAGSFVVNGGALGSPSSAGTIPAFTLGGTIAGGGNQINNVIIGASTPLAGSFTTATASTSVTSPLLLGGTAAGSTLTLQSTSGTGSGDAVLVKTGTNGGTVPLHITSTGLGVNTAGNPVADLQVGGAGGTNAGFEVVAGATMSFQFYNRNTSAYAAAAIAGLALNFQAGSSPATVFQVAAGSFNFTSSLKLLLSTTAPTVASGFCTSPTIPNANGTASFTVNVGSACAGSTGTLTMPTANAGWSCDFTDISTPASNSVWQTGGSASTVVITNYSRTTGLAANFGSSDVIAGKCSAY